MSRRPTPSPFQALRDLKGKLASTPPAAPTPSAPTDNAVPLAEDETDLLAQAFAGAKPLGRVNQAQLDKAKPAPRPRPRQSEACEEPPAPRRPQKLDPNDPMALFLASVGDVTPIKETGRAEIGPRPTRKQRRATVQEAAVALPTSLDPAISQDPAALFRYMAGSVTPLPDKNLADIHRPLPAPRPRPRQEAEKLPTPSAPPPLSDRADAPSDGDHLRNGAPNRLLADLRRGRIKVETEVDLHGYTRDEARQFLSDALARCGRRGQRCLRVIHGKGLSSPGGEPLLKNLTRSWLTQHPEVLAFCEAKPDEGGSGALLVLLRTPRRSPGQDEN